MTTPSELPGYHWNPLGTSKKQIWSPYGAIPESGWDHYVRLGGNPPQYLCNKFGLLLEIPWPPILNPNGTFVGSPPVPSACFGIPFREAHGISLNPLRNHAQIPCGALFNAFQPTLGPLQICSRLPAETISSPMRMRCASSRTTPGVDLTSM